MAAHYPRIRGIGAFQSGAGSQSHRIGGNQVSPNIGDLLLIFLESANETFTPDTGFLEAPSSPQSIGTAGGANATRLTIFYKISDGTEVNYVTGDSGNHNCVASFIIEGVDRENPFNANAGNTAAASTALTCPAVTTTRPECLIINAVATDRDLNSSNNFSGETNANLTNLTEQIDNSTNQQAGGGLYVLTGEKGTAGSTGTTTATQAASEETARITLAIAPLRRRISVT